MMLVPREVYPDYACTEYGGTGWAATVCNERHGSVLLRFLHARTPGGQEYERVRLRRDVLRPLP
jgi:hypothetical protein